MAKEKYEYVLINDHAQVVSNLQGSSADMQNSIADAYAVHNLDGQKQEFIKTAQAIVTSLQADIALLKKNMPIKDMGNLRQPRYKPKPAPSQVPDKDFMERSQRALANMNQNLANMRMHLR